MIHNSTFSSLLSLSLQRTTSHKEFPDKNVRVQKALDCDIFPWCSFSIFLSLFCQDVLKLKLKVGVSLNSTCSSLLSLSLEKTTSREEFPEEEEEKTSQMGEFRGRWTVTFPSRFFFPDLSSYCRDVLKFFFSFPCLSLLGCLHPSLFAKRERYETHETERSTTKAGSQQLWKVTKGVFH